MSLAPVKIFVARTGNAFMRDIAEWLQQGVADTGRSVALVDDHLPSLDGSLNLVVAPHEFFELFDAPKQDLQQAAACSIAVCTEQPGTPWFRLTVEVCQRGLFAVDINAHGVAALRDQGINAHRLALGGVSSLVAPNAQPTAQRTTDVLFMGGLDPRRGAALADLAPQLYGLNADLRLLRFDRPVEPNTPGLVFGDAKFRLVSQAKTLLNIHRDRSLHLSPGAQPAAYFEWARMIETMANGCVVISEPSEGFEPLVPGVHFVEAPLPDLGDALTELLANPRRLDQIAADAQDAVLHDLTLQHSLAPLLATIEAEVLPELAAHVAKGRYTWGVWRLGQSRVPPPKRMPVFRPFLAVQQRAKRIALAENQALRDLDAATCLLRHGTRQHIDRFETPAFCAATPEVSVVVSLYNYAEVVTETLDSLLASQDIAMEIIVVEDHATDHSRAAMRAYMDAHPQAPIMLLAKDANEGLAAARNTGFQQARADYVMVIDADNLVYPTCLRKLSDALTANQDAGAAYSILEDFGGERNLRSALAWDPGRLCAANYIDAQAMFRRANWEALGGYRANDDHVFGWEDWDLWLRFVQAGQCAILVPQILGRYRVQLGSMIALTNLATDDAIQAIRDLYPTLPWPTSP